MFASGASTGGVVSTTLTVNVTGRGGVEGRIGGVAGHRGQPEREQPARHRRASDRNGKVDVVVRGGNGVGRDRARAIDGTRDDVGVRIDDRRSRVGRRRPGRTDFRADGRDERAIDPGDTQLGEDHAGQSGRVVEGREDGPAGDTPNNTCTRSTPVLS